MKATDKTARKLPSSEIAERFANDVNEIVIGTVSDIYKLADKYGLEAREILKDLADGFYEVIINRKNKHTESEDN